MRSEGGGAKKDATLQHVLCGECEGIPEDTRAVVKEGMATHLRMALRAMTRRDRRGAAVVARREAAVAQIGAAQRALAKGEARSTALEREAMARWLAGDLPAAGTAGEATAKEAGVAREVVAAVRAAQTVAATARAAWEKEARAEVARRAERGERGRMEVHHQVRAGGFDAWRAQARVVGENESGQESGEQRKGAGWTLAAMMIRYKHREVRERARRAEARRGERAREGEEAELRAAGTGALVLAAATRLRGTPEEHTGVVGAVYVPSGASMGTARERSEEMAFWCEGAKGHGEEGMGELLEWMDRAGAIVVYETGWMHEGMGGAYGGDEERRAAHLRKVVDVGEHVRREHGRAVRESTFLRANGQSRHAGTRCDVDGVWEQGRIEVARDACMRDARAMAEVALARVVRSADGREMRGLRPARAAVVGEEGGEETGAARAVGAPQVQQQEPATRPHEERRNGGGRKGKRARTAGSESGGSGAAGPSAAGAAEAAGTRTEETRGGEDAAAQEILLETPQRPKRTGIGSASYVYTRQYNKRAKRQGYMLRNGQAHTLGKRAVEIGPATVERATRGRYDWQDGGLRKRRREDEREEGERRLRPRDPGKRGKHQ